MKYRSRLSEIETKSADDDEEDDSEAESSDESWNSEDDPDRLWCICKKPHNNRFMICCDLCEDWFHGKCVGVTKSMGMLPVHCLKIYMTFLSVYKENSVLQHILLQHVSRKSCNFM